MSKLKIKVMSYTDYARRYMHVPHRERPKIIIYPDVLEAVEGLKIDVKKFFGVKEDEEVCDMIDARFGK